MVCQGTGLSWDFPSLDGTVCLAARLASQGLLTAAGEVMRNIRSKSMNHVGAIYVPPGSQSCSHSLHPLVGEQ